MKIAFVVGDAEVSWRADDSDASGKRRLEMLRTSVGIDEVPDDGTATCRLVPRSAFAPGRGIGIPRHAMRVDFTHAADTGAEAAFSEVAGPEAGPTSWRGVRKLLFLGLVPLMASGKCSMVHGALMEKNGRAVLLTGPSGMGKSTTARRMAAEGFGVLADDCFLLRRDGNGTYCARPLPTWSIYLFGKEPVVECDARRELPVSRLFILGRNEERYTSLDPQMALLGCANAFTDMVQWHIFRYPERLAALLTERALEAAERLTKELPCGALQLTLDCDISRLLPEI